MHDIDSTHNEMNPETDGRESAFEGSYEGTSGESSESSNESQEVSGEMSFESPFGEVDEVALAAELLQVSNDRELDHFLGSLIKRAGRAVGKAISSPIGQALGGALRTVAKVGLPLAGGALGTVFGGPIGGMVGRQLGSFVGGQLEMNPEMLNLEGLNLEGASLEDRDFEIARRFVRTAGAAVRHATRTRYRGDPRSLARYSVSAASRQHAPWLMRNWRGGADGDGGNGRGGGGGFARRRASRGGPGYQPGQRPYWYGVPWPVDVDLNFDPASAEPPYGPPPEQPGSDPDSDAMGDSDQEFGPFPGGETPRGPVAGLSSRAPRRWGHRLPLAGRWYRKGNSIVLMLL
jgi:hypothetical protein